MGVAIMKLSEDREATAGKLKRVSELEQQLKLVERRLSVERDTSEELELEASCRAQDLQEAQAKVIEATVQVKVLRKELELLRRQSTRFEARAMVAKEHDSKTENEASLLKEELPKRHYDAVDEFKDN